MKLSFPTGCGFQFSSETDADDPLEVLKEGDQQVVVLPSENCTIDSSTSTYLDCRTWRPIDEISVLNTFSLNQSCMESPMLKASNLILPRKKAYKILTSPLSSDLIVYYLEAKTVRELKQTLLFGI